MKNAYLNDVITFRVYLRVIQKKYFVNKRQRKQNTAKDSPYIPVNSIWEDLKQERIERVRAFDCKNERTKWTSSVLVGFYTVFLPRESSTEY
jgi:hypothetical protein